MPDRDSPESREITLKDSSQAIETHVDMLKRATGIVVVGEKEADLAGVAIPEKYSVKALLAKDPFDPSVQVAQNYGLGFDAETNRWLLVRLTVIPGSWGLNRENRLALPQYEFEGLTTSIPSTESDSRACYRIVKKIFLSEQLPGHIFMCIFAATDWESTSGCRFIFGNSRVDGVCSLLNYEDNHKHFHVGAASFVN